MRRTLDNGQIAIVEAVCVCIIKKPFRKNIEDKLVEHVYNMNIYMYIYLLWLLKRWRPLYSKYHEHLPKNIYRLV